MAKPKNWYAAQTQKRPPKMASSFDPIHSKRRLCLLRRNKNKTEQTLKKETPKPFPKNISSDKK